MTSNARPDLNLFVRTFVPGAGVNQPLDLARTEFKLFLRYATSSIALLLTFIMAVRATETFTLERTKETWNSLLATPITAAPSCSRRSWRRCGGYGSRSRSWEFCGRSAYSREPSIRSAISSRC